MIHVLSQPQLDLTSKKTLYLIQKYSDLIKNATSETKIQKSKPYTNLEKTGRIHMNLIRKTQIGLNTFSTD